MRPEGWENPYGEPDEKGRTTPLSRIYEAGADAMLEGLKKQGILKEVVYGYELTVFILEEKE